MHVFQTDAASVWNQNKSYHLPVAKECLFCHCGPICLMTQLLGCGADDCFLCHSEFLGRCKEKNTCSLIGVSWSLPEWRWGEWLYFPGGSGLLLLRWMEGCFLCCKSWWLIIWSLKIPSAISNRVWDELLKLCHVQYAAACCVLGFH